MGAGDPLYDVGAYNALVDRVRKKGGGDSIGGRNHYDILKLIDLEKKIDAGEAARTAARPFNDAAARFHRSYQQIGAVVVKINEYQKILVAQRRLHEIHGASPEMFEPVPPPIWPSPDLKSIAEYDEASERLSVEATLLEGRAHKMRSYLAMWDAGGIAEQNRRMILALANRLDRLEAGER
jgi:hypothetical protein